MAGAALSKEARGAVLAVVGGIGWGFSGACAQYLFLHYGLQPVWLTSVRMISAGVVLLVLSLLLHRGEFARMVRKPWALGRTFAYGILGIMLCQLTYLMAIMYSNAGTATVLEYIGPVLIVVFVCFKGHRAPTVREIAAVVCVSLGTFLLATHGNPTNLAMTPQALAWGLAAAVAVALYTLLPGHLMQHFSSITVLAGGMLTGGVAMCLGSQAWLHAPAFGAGGLDAAGFAVLAIGMIVVGTILSFIAYMQAISDIGPAKTSLIASVETVSATVFAVLWLGTSFAAMDLVGFLLIMSTVFLLARR